MSALDTQIGGSHYKDMAIQPVEYIVKNRIPYREANIIKYVSRYASKNGLQDLEKARHYLEMLIDELSQKDTIISDKNTTVADPESDRLDPDEGWIEWSGGGAGQDADCPLEARGRVLVKQRSHQDSGGVEIIGAHENWNYYGNDPQDIIAYRVIGDK